MTYDPDCPFCAIAAGKDPRAIVICEDDAWVAFFPDTPATPGHTLLIPRVHVADYWEASPAVVATLGQAALLVGQAITSVVEPEGMNLITSSGESAEQSVFHLHVHLVPRWARDAIGPIWPAKRELDANLREGLADELAAACTANLATD